MAPNIKSVNAKSPILDRSLPGGTRFTPSMPVIDHGSAISLAGESYG
jgi:hypothetical protein